MYTYISLNTIKEKKPKRKHLINTANVATCQFRMFYTQILTNTIASHHPSVCMCAWVEWAIEPIHTGNSVHEYDSKFKYIRALVFDLIVSGSVFVSDVCCISLCCDWCKCLRFESLRSSAFLSLYAFVFSRQK